MIDVDPRLQPWIDALRREPAVRPAARRRLEAALRAEDARAARRILTPPAALAAALALVALTSAFWLTIGGIELPRRDAAVAGADGPGDGLTPVQFVFHAQEARTVSLVGDFNDWDPEATPLTPMGEGVWSVVVPLRPGVVRYSFLVDGSEWRADPRGLPARSDFGRPTSVAYIGPGGAL